MPGPLIACAIAPCVSRRVLPSLAAAGQPLDSMLGVPALNDPDAVTRDMQEQINALRRRLGQAKTPDRAQPDLTEAGLEALQVARERLQVHDCWLALHWLTMQLVLHRVDIQPGL